MGDRRLRAAGVLFAVLLAVYLATATWDELITNDQVATSVSAWSLGEHGTFVVPQSWQDVPWPAVTTNGETVTNRFPGAIVWGAVFYAVIPGEASPQRAHDVPFAPATIAAAFAAAMASAVVFVVLDRIVERRIAVGGAVLLGLGTGTWSVSSDSLFTHGPAQLAFALGLLALTRNRMLLAGLAFGAAITTRPSLAIVALVCGLWLGASRRQLRPVVAIGVGSAAGLAAVSLYTWLLFGTWAPRAGYTVGDQGFTLFERLFGSGETPAAWESLIGMLLHPRRGVLLYSAFLVVLLPGLRRAWRAAPDWVRASAIGGLAILPVHAIAQPGAFHGGEDFFGYRIPLETLTLSAPLLALSASHFALRSWLGRRALALTGVASIVAFGLGSTVADPREIDRQAHFAWLDSLGPHGEGYDPETAVGVDASLSDE